MRNYSASAARGASVWMTGKALREAIERYCPLPWTPLTLQRVGLKARYTLVRPPKGTGEGGEE